MPRILLISPNEICYNARLLKAADFFHDKGWEVTVFNGVTGIAPRKVYDEIKASRPWDIIENDISKNKLKSKFKWLLTSLLHKCVQISIDRFKLPLWNRYYLNKALLLRPNIERANYDYILIHLIDNLPFAVHLKNKTNAKIIYDSQEYFVGQYAAFEQNKFKWVKDNEEKFISEVDILLATTNAMLDQLNKDYQLKIPAFRVRNVPAFHKIETSDLILDTIFKEEHRTNSIKLVWHGMGIFFNNRRGVHILLEAIAQCNEDVHLYLQGNLNETQKLIYNDYEQKLNLFDKVTFVPAAHPDQIVDSLKGYDIGLTGELPEEMNQELTSSNKLFDYIHAGLAVISSDALGLAETIDEFNVGLKYEPGNIEELRDKIDLLASRPIKLKQLKQNSLAAMRQLYWEKDYQKVLEQLDI